MMKRTILIMAVLVLVAGCTAPQPGGGNQEEKPKVIAVTGPECTVAGQRCADQQLTKYDDGVNVRLTVVNNGESAMILNVSNPSSGVGNGRRVLVSTCNTDIADITSFDPRLIGPTTSRSGADVYSTGDHTKVSIGPDQQLILEWTFELVPDGGQVSRLGYSCPLDFALTFSQTLQSTRQVQVRASTDVPEVSSVDTSTTSKRPVHLVIDAPKSFIYSESSDGTTKPIVVRGYVQNRDRGTITNVGYIRGQGWMADNADSCENMDVFMNREGQRSGESSRLICVVTPPERPSPSDVHLLEMEAQYDYEMSLQSQTIDIHPVEGE